MLRTAVKKLKHLPSLIWEAGSRIRRKKLARRVQIEEREREALVGELTKKFAAAHADCEEHTKPITKIEFAIKEIIFIEEYLETWNRHFAEREIYRLPPTSNL